MTIEQTTAFLDLIQPSEGWRCLFVLPDKRHYWFQNTATMAEAALELDAQGKAVFHGCATFNDPGPDNWVPNPKKPGKKKRNWDNDKRKQNNVTGLKAFWLDIDTGPGKPYADPSEAYRALEAWRTTAGLPVCVVVASGGGLHCYWPLLTALDPARWLGAANRLRFLAERHGLAIDPSSTIDAARILRPPGTHNRKILDPQGKKLADVGGEPRLVRCGPAVGPYELSELAPLLVADAGIPASATTSVLPTAPTYLKGLSTPSTLTNIYPDEPSDPEIIARECAQMRNVGENPAGGWYPITGVLAFCGQAGHDYAVKIATDPVWIPTIKEKLQQWRDKASGPTTCERFTVLNPLGCAGCQHRGHVTSPIQLGRAGALQHPAEPPPPKPIVDTLPPVPLPFFWRSGKLYRQAKEPTDPPTIVADHPVHISALQQGERIDGLSAVFRSWRPIYQDWVEFVAPLKEVYSDRGMGLMAHHGVVILKSRWPSFHEFIGRSVMSLQESQRYGVRYDQFGWKPEGFVWGEQLYQKATAPARAYGSREVTNRGKLMQPHGAAAQWSSVVNTLFDQPGMEAHQFIVLSSFAAPLYKFTGAVGGTIAHAQSSETGHAKTTAMAAGASVWGDGPAVETIQADTLVAKFISFGTLCNLPIFYDELRSPDVAVMKDLVLQFSLGRDKQRGSVEGGLRGDALPWSTIMVSASNLSLVDAVRSDGGEKAHAARIFEFPVRLPREARRTDHTALEETFKANRGSAGKIFLQEVLDRQEEIAAQVPQFMACLEQQLGDGPEMRYIVRLLASIAVAGKLCQKLGLVTFDVKKILGWAIATARGNQTRIDDDRQTDLASIAGALINDMMPATLIMQRAVKPGPQAADRPVKEPRDALWARYEVETKLWECDVRAIRTWMQKNNHSFTDIEKQLLGSGALVAANRQRTLARGSTLARAQVRVWEIDGNHPMIAEQVDPLTEKESNILPFPVAR